MKILVLGGTQFVGRAFVEAMRGRDDVRLTLFNRGKSHPDLFPEIERITGNRETDDIEQLTDREWDVVVDCCGYYPRSLSQLSTMLRPHVQRYVFISTLSVYDFGAELRVPITEHDAIFSCDDQQKVDTTLNTYGARKAECERVLLDQWGRDVVILRPSIIYGKYDPTDRFYYWMYRVKQGRTILLPEGGLDVVNFTYIDDLVFTMIRAIELPHHQSVYNVTTHDPQPFVNFLMGIAESLGTTIRGVSIDSERINAESLQMGIDFPLCFGVPLHISADRLRADLLAQPLSLHQSFRRCADWYDTLSWPIPRTGLSLERESEILRELGIE